jgi:hypothetical protein
MMEREDEGGFAEGSKVFVRLNANSYMTSKCLAIRYHIKEKF